MQDLAKCISSLSARGEGSFRMYVDFSHGKKGDKADTILLPCERRRYKQPSRRLARKNQIRSRARAAPARLADHKGTS